MDYELKLAFEECSSSLEIFRIRWEGAFDAMHVKSNTIVVAGISTV